jgi:hypothetical protein
LEENAEQNQHQAAPDKNDFLDAVVANDRNVVLDVWITIEELVSAAKNEDSGKQKDDHGESESDAQRRKARRFNHCSQRSYPVSN